MGKGFDIVSMQLKIISWNVRGLKKGEMTSGLKFAAEGRLMERIVVELEKTNLLKEISWRQKSRAIWLKERDVNTRFFHHLENSNKRYNSISTLFINGDMSTDPATITQYYNGLYMEEVEWRPKLDGLEFSMIFAKDVAWLNKPFDEEEVARWLSHG